MCWMLTVVMTAMPASRISSTSSQRFSWRPEPGTFVWASSSIRTTSGLRAMTASTSISSQTEFRYSTCLARDDGQVADLLHRVGPLVRLDEPDHDVGPALEATPPLVEHGARLADAGRRAEVHTEAPGGPYPLVFTASCSSAPFAGSHQCVGTLGGPSEGRKAVTYVRRSRLVTKGNVPAYGVGDRRHAGRPGRAPGPAAPLPLPPEHRHPGAGVRAAGLDGRRHRRLRPRRRRRARRLPRLRLLLPPAVQHPDGALAPELDRARRLRRRRARRGPGRRQAQRAHGRRRCGGPRSRSGCSSCRRRSSATSPSRSC